MRNGEGVNAAQLNSHAVVAASKSCDVATNMNIEHACIRTLIYQPCYCIHIADITLKISHSKIPQKQV